MLLFADDLILLATSEDDLQRAVQNLNTVATKYMYSVEISV
jgi:hypothetical protein